MTHSIPRKNVVWYDRNIYNPENEGYFHRCLKGWTEVKRFTDWTIAAEFLDASKEKSWIVVISCFTYLDFISKIHDFPNVSNILVFNPFCSGSSEIWLNKFKKMNMIKNIGELMEELHILNAKEVFSDFEEFGENSNGYLQTTKVKVPMSLLPLIKAFFTTHGFTSDRLLQELKEINLNTKCDIEKEYKERCKDPLHAIIYLYSTNAIYRHFNGNFAKKKYEKVTITTCTALSHIQKRKDLLLQEPTLLYRGMSHGEAKRDYNIGELVYWPAFTSCTKSLKKAEYFAKSKGIVFEINLFQGLPHPHIELPPKWSLLSSEKEVLLFPYFAFNVVSSRCENGITHINVTQNEDIHIFSLDKSKMFTFWEEISKRCCKFCKGIYDPYLKLGDKASCADCLFTFYLNEVNLDLALKIDDILFFPEAQGAKALCVKEFDLLEEAQELFNKFIDEKSLKKFDIAWTCNLYKHDTGVLDDDLIYITRLQCLLAHDYLTKNYEEFQPIEQKTLYSLSKALYYYSMYGSSFNILLNLDLEDESGNSFMSWNCYIMEEKISREIYDSTTRNKIAAPVRVFFTAKESDLRSVEFLFQRLLFLFYWTVPQKEKDLSNVLDFRTFWSIKKPYPCSDWEINVEETLMKIGDEKMELLNAMLQKDLKKYEQSIHK